MKNILLLLCLICISTLVTGQGIRFEEGNLEEAQAKAKREGKMLFIDAYAEWCGPCKWMSNNVFKESVVGEYFDKYVVAIKIDVERGEGPAIKIRYAIDGLPGYLFMDSEGNIVCRDGGRMATDKFMAVVKKAHEYAQDPNSVGRLAARYPMEKENEFFLKTYLDRLKSSGSAAYYEVVEQFLKVQKSIAPSSREMVQLLNDHALSLIFGGEADRIIRENIDTDTWGLYVRKNIREVFQKLPESMAKQTVEYAIMKRDTTLIDLALERAKEYGVMFPDEQRERLLVYYYSQTGEGEKYKRFVKPQIEGFYATLDVKALREAERRTQERMRNNPSVNARSFAVTKSERLRHMASEYARFVTSDEDKACMLKWAQIIYDIYPEEVKNKVFHAKAEYLYGDKAKGLRLMEEVVNMTSGNKNEVGFLKDLELMKAGEVVVLMF